MVFFFFYYFLPHTEERAFIEGIPQDERSSFEKKSDYLKTFSKPLDKSKILV